VVGQKFVLAPATSGIGWAFKKWGQGAPDEHYSSDRTQGYVP
jgi:hypothetical protein